MKRAAALILAALSVPAATAVAGEVRAGQVTLQATPTVLQRMPRVLLSGRIPLARAAELVTIQGKECGVPGAFFRALGGAQTAADGTWRVDTPVRTTTELRAVWRDQQSPTVTVKARIGVSLFRRGADRFEISAGGIGANMRAKRAAVERFDRRFGRWTVLRSVRLVPEGTSYGSATVRLTLPAGSTIRATIPASQAGPCLLGGYSTLVRT